MQIWIQPRYIPGINGSHVLPLSAQMIAGILGDETQHLYAVSPTNLWCLRRHLRIAPLAILSQSKV
jgi:hypothetical protein